MGFGMTVVLPADDEETFIRTTDPDSTMADGLYDGDMLFLAQVIEDQRISNCPYLRWVSGPSEEGAHHLGDARRRLARDRGAAQDVARYQPRDDRPDSIGLSVCGLYQRPRVLRGLVLMGSCGSRSGR
jgi:hypothetical protein